MSIEFPAPPKLSETAYNAIDTLATIRNFQELLKEDHGRQAYLFDQAIIGPAMTMQMRGIRVDQKKIKDADEETCDVASDLQKEFEAIAGNWAALEGKKWAWGKSLKPSPMQLAKLLYGPLKVKVRTNQEGAPTVDKEAIASIIEDPKTPETALRIAELNQELAVLEEDRKVLRKPLREDGRFHSSYNVAGTSSGRFNAKKDEFDTGGNIQALSKRLHQIFIPDPGYIFVNIDQKQAESKGVSFLAGCEKYKEFHATGNTHVKVGEILFPELKLNKDQAKETKVPWSKTMTYYDLFKRVQHACLLPHIEILTKSGWVRCDQYDGSSEIAVWRDDSILSWEVPKLWNSYNYCGSTIIYKGRNLNFSVTENHKIPVKNNGRVIEKQAQDFRFTYGMCPLTGELQDESISLNKAEATLLAATWADGHVRRDGWTIFSFSKQRKINRIKAILDEAKLTWTVWTRGKNRTGEVIATKKSLRKNLGWDLLLWSYENRKIFLDELVHWDGHKNKKRRGIRIFNVDRKGMEIIATICHITGYAAKIVPHGNCSNNRQQCWYLYIREKQNGGNHTQTSYNKKYVSYSQFEGKVYCPTVSTGWFLIRSEGLISVTGNSNYCQTARGLAHHIHSKIDKANEIQIKYFQFFHEIRDWQMEIAQKLKVYHYLTTPLGRTRMFFGRTWDNSLVKEGVAYIPQSLISQINKIIMWRIWSRFDSDRAQLLSECHDSNLFQIKEGDSETLEEILERAKVTVPVRGDVMHTEVEAHWGYSWGERDLQEWKGRF